MSGWKPLVWRPSGDGMSVDGRVPDCRVCRGRLDTASFIDSVRLVAAEHSENEALLAKRFIDAFHANRHREDA